MKKISLLLVVALLLSVMPTSILAAELNDYRDGSQVFYSSPNTETYSITVPAVIEPGSGGTVTLSGQWPSDKTITVTAQKSVTLTNSINPADETTLTVEFPGIVAAGNNKTSQTYTAPVTVSEIKDALFGDWSGYFYYDVSVSGPNYVGVVTADNSIVLNGVETAGQYTLRYENAEGPLTGVADICTLNVTNPAESVTYDDFVSANGAPAAASTIGVYNASGEKVGDVALAGLKSNFGSKLYSFGALADLHVADGANTNVANAVKYLKTQGVDFICAQGDLTNDCTDAEWNNLHSIMSTNAANVPVYLVAGNHDTAYQASLSGLSAFGGFGMSEHSDVKEWLENYLENPFYYSFTRGDDVFVMMGVQSNSTLTPFPYQELQWLSDTLEANRNKRVFLFQHLVVTDDSGNANGWYDYKSWHGAEAEAFMNLLNHYPNVTWFHGHSHQAFEMQLVDDNATYVNNSGSHSIHVPSASATKAPSEYSQYFGKSQGYIVDVYESGIVINGIDFATCKQMPLGTYTIDTTIQNVVADTFVDDECIMNCGIDFEWINGKRVNRDSGVVSNNVEHAITPLLSVANQTVWYHAYENDYHSIEVFCYDSAGNYLGYNKVTFSEGAPYLAPVCLNDYFKDGTASIRIDYWHGNYTNAFARFVLPAHLTARENSAST